MLIADRRWCLLDLRVGRCSRRVIAIRRCVAALRNKRLDVPDHLGVFIDTSVTAEEAHACNGGDGLGSPFILVLVGLVDELVSLAIGCEVVGDEVVITVFDDSVDECGKGACVTEGALLDFVEDLGEGLVELVVSVDVGVAKVFDVLRKITEEEDVVLADLASDLDLLFSVLAVITNEDDMRMTYVGTVAGSDDQTTVENELHVTCTTGLSTGSRDVLRDVGGRNNDLCLRDIVVRDEDNLESIANIRVVVDNITNLVDQVNDGLGHPVTRSSLSTEDGDAGSELLTLLWRHGLDGEVAVDDTEDVHLLTLVLVHTLDLHVEESGRVD